MPSRNKITIEVCVDSFEMALLSQKAGATRIELCSSLTEGGITPALSQMEKAGEGLKIPAHIMIRPRGGDFLYSNLEFDLMKSDIRHAKRAGASGVVFGILRTDGSIDAPRCRELVELARPMHTTLHRAFDLTSDPFLALEEVISLGFNSILTSGQRQVAEDGLEMIRELVKRAGERIEVIAGSGIQSSNVMLLAKAGVKAFHFTSRMKTNSRMQYRNNALTSMGTLTPANEYEQYIFDEQKIKSIIDLIKPAAQ